MLAIQGVPLLLALLVGILLGLATVGLLRNRVRRTAVIDPAGRSDLLSGMLVLGAFAMGAFVTYVLLGPR
jgi:hypothetical protein